jgi:isopentenyl-diphosphate delta-isomerase
MTSSTDNDPVILVDANDVAVGTAGKLDAHRRGLKHRAISVLVRNSEGEFLLQRRNPAKYHSGGLWTNACCSHPYPGESVAAAARRRLAQEMGIDCPLEPLFVLHYHTPVSDGLIENEVVHVFGAHYDGPVKPDPAEASEWKWIAYADLARDMRARPQAYTIWFREYVGQRGDLIAKWIGRKR